MSVDMTERAKEVQEKYNDELLSKPQRHRHCCRPPYTPGVLYR